ncbi:class I SAM-dependent methyltransferase [Pontiellaceae bacterium B1224]|nr:class I SAM-dependent methyltransferase [Pontiellaceae bacterium B1224]
MKQMMLNQMLKFSARMRRKRMQRFLSYFKLNATTRILDVGGSGDWNWKSFGVNAEVTTVNLNPPKPGQLNYVQGSACDMHMFSDGEFDLVFSNSVIEHLLSREDQRCMAAEIQRVGNAYWIQTPNRYFPIELHLCFPFVQFFPKAGKLFVARHWPFSFQKLRGKPEGAVADAQAILLTKADMKELFPGSYLICERFLGMTKSLIVTGDKDA